MRLVCFLWPCHGPENETLNSQCDVWVYAGCFSAHSRVAPLGFQLLDPFAYFFPSGKLQGRRTAHSPVPAVLVLVMSEGLSKGLPNIVHYSNPPHRQDRGRGRNSPFF